MMPASLKPNVDMAVLDRIDIRVGTIVSVDDVPNSKKLVMLQVDLGDHHRCVVAGLKSERDDPQEIVGQQALFVVNLEPQTLAGILSEGMLFDIGYPDKITPVLAQPASPVPNGTRAG